MARKVGCKEGMWALSETRKIARLAGVISMRKSAASREPRSQGIDRGPGCPGRPRSHRHRSLLDVGIHRAGQEDAVGNRVSVAEMLPSAARMDRRRQYLLLVIAILVAVTVALYPYAREAGFCGSSDQCPRASQDQGMLSTGFGVGCVAAVLVTFFATLVITVPRWRHRRFSDPNPQETFLSLDPPPPRLLFI